MSEIGNLALQQRTSEAVLKDRTDDLAITFVFHVFGFEGGTRL